MFEPRLKKASTSVGRAVGPRRNERSEICSRPLQVLQRALGNEAFGVLQAKMTLGQPGDKYEQEADRVADAVMRMPEPRVQRQDLAEEEEKEEEVQAKPLAGQITPLVQRQDEVKDEEEEEEGPVQAKLLTASAQVQRNELDEEEDEEVVNAKSTPGQTPEVTPGLEARINAMRSSGGQPLDSATRAFMEPRFGFDFSPVRVHTGSRATESARALNAQAFTVASNVVFGAGHYAPETHQGKRLMAHELTHVVQQSGERGHRRSFEQSLTHKKAKQPNRDSQVKKNASPSAVPARNMTPRRRLDVPQLVSEASTTVDATKTLVQRQIQRRAQPHGMGQRSDNAGGKENTRKEIKKYAEKILGRVGKRLTFEKRDGMEDRRHTEIQLKALKGEGKLTVRIKIDENNLRQSGYCVDSLRKHEYDVMAKPSNRNPKYEKSRCRSGGFDEVTFCGNKMCIPEKSEKREFGFDLLRGREERIKEILFSVDSILNQRSLTLGSFLLQTKGKQLGCIPFRARTESHGTGAAIDRPFAPERPAAVENVIDILQALPPGRYRIGIPAGSEFFEFSDYGKALKFNEREAGDLKKRLWSDFVKQIERAEQALKRKESEEIFGEWLEWGDWRYCSDWTVPPGRIFPVWTLLQLEYWKSERVPGKGKRGKSEWKHRFKANFVKYLTDSRELKSIPLRKEAKAELGNAAVIKINKYLEGLDEKLKEWRIIESNLSSPEGLEIYKSKFQKKVLVKSELIKKRKGQAYWRHTCKNVPQERLAVSVLQNDDLRDYLTDSSIDAYLPHPDKEFDVMIDDTGHLHIQVHAPAERESQPRC